MLNKEVIEKHFKRRKYLHFDWSYHFNSVKKDIIKPENIALHGFLPLIYYVEETQRYSEEPNPEQGNRPMKEKSRDIMYAGHLDNYIYKYYSLKLNESYDTWTKNNNIDNCSIAYRNNKQGLSNINFAAEVINQIVNYKEAFVMVGDFTKFFDEIDHKLLKEKLVSVLGGIKLTDDWYNVYRSLTKFGYYKKAEINESFGSDKSFRDKRQFSYFKSLNVFRRFQKNKKPEYNKEKYGIPQGTALSGVLANVYAIDFDLKLQKIAEQFDGLYRRYSDDFILVIPKQILLNEFHNIVNKVYVLAKENKIELQIEKTHTYKYSMEKIVNLDENEKPYIDYLGFIFDGKSVKMRSKSPYKFYRNAYKLIKKAKKVKLEKDLDKLPYRKQIYKLYTDFGSKRKPFGNFITYAKRAQETFDIVSPNTENKMLNQIKNRKKKLEKEMGVKFHIRV